MDPLLPPDMNESPADFEDGRAFAPDNRGAFSGRGEAGGVYTSKNQPQNQEEQLLSRVPPHSVEAEQALLGAVLFKNNALHLVVDMIRPTDFYLPAHQLIFNAFLDLYRKNHPVDLVTVMEILRARGELEKAGGAGYLADLSAAMLTAANAENYAQLVRDRALQRSLIDVCSEIIGKSYQAPDVESLLDESEQAVMAISGRAGDKVFSSSGEMVHKVMDELTERLGKAGHLTGVDTGYTKLNEMTAGFQPSDLIIIAARPSVGKTALALNLCLNAAKQGVPVGVFSLEMSKEQIITRMMAIEAKVPLSKLRSFDLNDNDWQRLQERLDGLASAPIYIDDSAALSTLELRGRIRRLHAQKGIGLVIIDYLQLMRSSRRTDSRELEISDISRSLKALAKELHIPVIALAQLNRKVEERTNKRPMLSDLRESGAIEQDADVILFLYRDAVYNKRDDNPRKAEAEVIIGKQRNGPTGVCGLAYVAEYTSFDELAYDYVPPPSEG